MFAPPSAVLQKFAAIIATKIANFGFGTLAMAPLLLAIGATVAHHLSDGLQCTSL
jgi:hypothetical protein